jgi:hypothetical protein
MAAGVEPKASDSITPVRAASAKAKPSATEARTTYSRNPAAATAASTPSTARVTIISSRLNPRSSLRYTAILLK